MGKHICLFGSEKFVFGGIVYAAQNGGDVVAMLGIALDRAIFNRFYGYKRAYANLAKHNEAQKRRHYALWHNFKMSKGQNYDYRKGHGRRAANRDKRKILFRAQNIQHGKHRKRTAAQ